MSADFWSRVPPERPKSQTEQFYVKLQSFSLLQRDPRYRFPGRDHCWLLSSNACFNLSTTI